MTIDAQRGVSRRRRRWAPVAALAALLLAISACSSGSGSGGDSDREANNTDEAVTVNGVLPDDGPPEYGGILRTNMTSETPTLDPHKSPSFAVPTAVAGTVYNKLVEFESSRELPHGTMKVRPDLAESYEQSSDGMTWTFNLRKGVMFQNVAPVNGREFTSADVACTLDRVKSVPSSGVYLLDPVASYDTSDPYKVVFRMKFPYAAFDESMAHFYMTMLPCEGTRGQFDLATRAIGTGPFIMTEFKRGVQTTYVRNPNYFVAGQPYLDGLVVTIVPDANAAMAAMRTGELDTTGSITEQLLPALVSTNADMVVRDQLVMGPNQIMFNVVKKPFDDYRVRKAIAMSIDRQGLGEAFYNEYFLITGPIPSVLFGGQDVEETQEMIPYDPEGAKELLAEAGYPNGFSAKMLTTSGYGQLFVSQAQWVQEDLRKVGINVELDMPDYTTYFAQFAAKDYDFGWGLSTSFLSADEYLQALYVTGASRNYFNFSDPKLDQMIKDQRSELDQDTREELLLNINRYILEEALPLWFAFQFPTLLTQQPWVHNLYTHSSYGRVYMATAWLDESAPTRK